jgi:hypothetical protein
MVRLSVLLGVVVAGLGIASSAAASHWVIQSTPKPPNARSRHLAGVSCRSGRACIAVGAYRIDSYPGSSMALAERWNGTKWLVMSALNPPGGFSQGGRGSWLNSVSCTSSESCTAVGAYRPTQADTMLPLAEYWNGRTWTIQPTPVPAGGSGVLSSISCPSAESCTAAGTDYSTGTNENPRTLAEHWDGSSWSLQSTPDPSEAAYTGGDRLLGVSCLSSQSCVATGTFVDSDSGNQVALVAQWDGTSWTPQPTPDAGYYAVLDGVSCPSAQFCSAVGRRYINGNVTLGESWDGTSWSLQSTPNGADAGEDPGAELKSVSCPSEQACTAVGSRALYGKGPALAMHWNGAKWSIQPTHNPGVDQTHYTAYYLLSVSCPSSRTCTAVGYTKQPYAKVDHRLLTLAERWQAR